MRPVTLFVLFGLAGCIDELPPPKNAKDAVMIVDAVCKARDDYREQIDGAASVVDEAASSSSEAKAEASVPSVDASGQTAGGDAAPSGKTKP